MYRTKYGLVDFRGTVGGKPVAFTTLRTTYGREVDSIVGFQMLNDPAAVTSAADFQRATSFIDYTFNWFYADSRDTAYYNSGLNPVRAATVDPSLPIVADAANDWRGYTPAAQHPQGVNQDYYVSWNNKQANGYSASGYGNGSVHRANLLDDRVRALVASGQKVTRASLTRAMADASASDLRGEDVLPELLRVLTSQPVTDPAQAAAVAELRTWRDHGAKRKGVTPGSHTYADAHAIQVFDAWWPLLVQASYQSAMGPELFGAMIAAIQINESPSGGQTGPSTGPAGANESIPHKGSAFQFGWWSYVDKDLRAVLGDPVAGGLSRKFCGDGDVAGCRQALLTALGQAAAQTAAQVYPADGDCAAGDQWCADSIIQRPMGGITDAKIAWQNRPTYQQVVQFPARRGTNIADLGLGRSVTATSFEHGLFHPYLPPELAVDGNMATRWGSDWSDDQSITIDLGGARQVGRVVLRWEAAYATAYTIQTSVDGTAWQDVFATTTGDGDLDNEAFTPVTARYVRMHGVHRATRYGYSLYDFEVYAG